jgi:hypothetical protein
MKFEPQHKTVIPDIKQEAVFSSRTFSIRHSATGSGPNAVLLASHSRGSLFGFQPKNQL